MSTHDHSLAPMVIPHTISAPLATKPPFKPMGIISYIFLLGAEAVSTACYHLAKPPQYMIPANLISASLRTTLPELSRQMTAMKHLKNQKVIEWFFREHECLVRHERLIRDVLECPKKTFWQFGERDISYDLRDFIDQLNTLHKASEVFLGIEYLLKTHHHLKPFATTPSTSDQTEWTVRALQLAPPDLALDPEWQEARELLATGAELIGACHSEEAVPLQGAEIITVSGARVYCQCGSTTPHIIREARQQYRAHSSDLYEWRTELLARKDDPQCLADFLLSINSLPLLVSDLEDLMQEMETFNEYEGGWFVDLCQYSLEDSGSNVENALDTVIRSLKKQEYSQVDHRRIERILRSFLPEPSIMNTSSPSPELFPKTIDVEAITQEAVEIWLKDRRGLQMELDIELGYLVSHVVMTFPKHEYGDVNALTMQDYCESRLSIPDAQVRFFGKRSREAVILTNAFRRGDAVQLVPENIAQESSIYATVIAFHESRDCIHADQDNCLCSTLERITGGMYEDHDQSH